jgi:hypothetical protein
MCKFVWLKCIRAGRCNEMAFKCRFQVSSTYSACISSGRCFDYTQWWRNLYLLDWILISFYWSLLSVWWIGFAYAMKLWLLSDISFLYCRRWITWIFRRIVMRFNQGSGMVMEHLLEYKWRNFGQLTEKNLFLVWETLLQKFMPACRTVTV